MKTIFLSSLMLFLCVSLLAQNVTYGIIMGVQKTGLNLESDFSLSNEVSDLKVTPKEGFSLGIHSLIRVASRVLLSPQFLMDFSNLELETEFSNDTRSNRSLQQSQVRIPLDIQLEIIRGANSLYLISGVEYEFGLDKEARNQFLDMEKNFWSGRIGIGGRKDFERFSVSPEITFAKSFNSIEGEENLVLNEVITGMNNAVLGLSVKFQGLLANE